MKKLTACIALLLIAELSAAGTPASVAVLGLDDAIKAASVALKRCADDGYQVSVAVIDRSGNLKVHLRHDQAGPHTVSSAQRKAFTAASMGRPTADLANLVKSKPELQGLQFMDDRLLLLGGGLPVRIGDKLVAGIGVGGAPGGHLDTACAKAGIEAIGAK